MANPLLQRYQQALESEKTFSDKLRDKRSAYEQFAKASAPLFQQDPGTDILSDPSARAANRQLLERALTGAVQPTAEERQFATGRADDLATSLSELLGTSETGLSEKERLDLELKARKEGFSLSTDPETGKLTITGKGATTEEQKEREKATQEKSETLILLDEILGSDLDPVTGRLRLGRGPIGQFFRPSTAQTTAKIEQLKSLLSLEQREKLRGTGQISDFESKMLEKSVAALNPKMSQEDYRDELEKVRFLLSFDRQGARDEGYTNKDIDDFVRQELRKL